MSPVNSANGSLFGLAVSITCSLSGACGVELMLADPGLAQETVPGQTGQSCVDWTKLELTGGQKSQIESLENQWLKDYNEIAPQIREDQLKLQKLLVEHNPDSMQIMTLQQSIARRKEQLNLCAVQNYISKKKVLNERQQTQYEQLMRAMVQKRKQFNNPGAQTEVMPDKVQVLMQKMRDIFPMDRQ